MMGPSAVRTWQTWLPRYVGFDVSQYGWLRKQYINTSVFQLLWRILRKKASSNHVLFSKSSGMGPFRISSLCFMALLGLASVTTTLCQPSNTKPVPSTLNITTLTAKNGFSVLECWSLVPGFTTSHQAGTSGAASIGIGELGSSTVNATFSIIPARFDGGIHNAPAAQYVLPLVIAWTPLLSNCTPTV